MKELLFVAGFYNSRFSICACSECRVLQTRVETSLDTVAAGEEARCDMMYSVWMYF